MSQLFFDELEIPSPAFNLEAGSGSHAVQTAKIMVSFEEICLSSRPDLVMVVGDVNSTLACSIVAKKLTIPVAHVEAGLRSFDLSMPEEINRMVTDAISDWFFVTEESGADNLLREGKPLGRIHKVGHVMVDNLYYQVKRLKETNTDGVQVGQQKKIAGKYLFMTLHRPSNVDNREIFLSITDAINDLASEREVFFPVHPRTREKMVEFGLRMNDRVHLLPPLGFRDSLSLWMDAEAVLTDSGGLQEETTALGVPCVTIRENTERPITVEMGTNVLAGTTKAGILDAYRRSLEKQGGARVPPLWDGMASDRIWEILMSG
jgi:UDP-N-acetylglucosamine 2-epimerase (non-hydrolysing)